MALRRAGASCQTRPMKLDTKEGTHPQSGRLAFWSKALHRAFSDTFRGAGLAEGTCSTSAWVSMVAAASEEVGDDSVFEFNLSLPPERTYEGLARLILTLGAEEPHLNAVVRKVAADFHLTEKQSLTAVDRTLGGMFRAMTGRPDARPSVDCDSVAAAAFDLCLREPHFMDAIWPGWSGWIEELERADPQPTAT